MTGSVVALSGGVGGAKLALGLARVIDPAKLTVVVNTADDFYHLGLAISPDIDTVVYTLAGLAHPVQGWGRRDETWSFMSALEQLGGPTWFRLGDADLAMHLQRTRHLSQGDTLASFTEQTCRRLGVTARVLPMTNCPVKTRVRTDAEWLDFQEYFVRRRCEPVVRELAFEGVESARPTPEVLTALRSEQLRAVVIGPSNPFLSIDPILAVPGIREALRSSRAPVVAVSPVIGGQAVKGPTAKMMRELGFESTAREIALRYSELIDALVVDDSDAGMACPPEVELVTSSILMTSLEDRERVASVALEIADRVASRKAQG